MEAKMTTLSKSANTQFKATNTVGHYSPKSENGSYEVVGQNESGEWTAKRADGLMCSGTWFSKADAQTDCDRWNARRKVA
jgi:hypothetical protein